MTTYNDTTVSKRKSYLCRVQAYNAAGVSAYTNVLSAKTPSASPSPAGGLALGAVDTEPTAPAIPAPAAKRGSPFSDVSILDDVLA